MDCQSFFWIRRYITGLWYNSANSGPSPIFSPLCLQLYNRYISWFQHVSAGCYENNNAPTKMIWTHRLLQTLLNSSHEPRLSLFSQQNMWNCLLFLGLLLLTPRCHKVKSIRIKQVGLHCNHLQGSTGKYRENPVMKTGTLQWEQGSPVMKAVFSLWELTYREKL